MTNPVTPNPSAPLAVFAGSFDPLTLGHVDLIERASRLFGQVAVVVAVNINKQPLFSLEERLGHLRASLAHLDNVQLHVMQGQLIADYARQLGAQVLVRGLRHAGDYHYELPIAAANRQLNPDLETIFLQARPDYQHISSSLVKEIASYGGPVENLVPAPVASALAEVYPSSQRPAESD